SDKPYRVRGTTRDTAKPVSKICRCLVCCPEKGRSVQGIYSIRSSTYYEFNPSLVTNFWEHLDKERETNEAELLVDAAKAAGVSRVVWSGSPFTSNLTGGKYVNNHHFDSKALVTEYARTAGIPFVDVQAGFYASNFLNNPIF
ncbi:NmrA-like family-domain-containing protein, partial [Mycena vitilis]